VSGQAPLLIEIGCEEIPSRMVQEAACELERCVVGCLDSGALSHGAARRFAGSRRLAVRVEDVAERQPDRVETVLGPAVQAAFDPGGGTTRAADGFARKHGIDPSRLRRVETAKGVYVGFERTVEGITVGDLLAASLPPGVRGMSFPKSMRWGDGSQRFVRPVHWLLALHGTRTLPVELFGIRAGSRSVGHRFLSRGAVDVGHPDAYEDALAGASVLVDTERRRRRLCEALERGAAQCDGKYVTDDALLDEVSNLVEWPGVFPGTFDPGFLELPRELLVTTLRHHQKCFSIEARGGELSPAFLAVANTDRDPRGHVRRGNEWVVVGRLEDARFFWNEDLKTSLGDLSPRLAGVVFHGKAGSFADKAGRMENLAATVAEKLDLSQGRIGHCRLAARWAKNDLVTSTVGEFPELQGRVGGLLLRGEGVDHAVADAVYDHYRPTAADDDLPGTEEGCIVSVADRIDSIAELIGAGEKPTGSRDPFGLRRAAGGIFRIVIDRQWPLSLRDLFELVAQRPEPYDFLSRQFQNHLKDVGFSVNEVHAVLQPRVSPTESQTWHLHDVVARLRALQRVRSRPDFDHLVDLTKRVDNILSKDSEVTRSVLEYDGGRDYRERDAAALRLDSMTEDYGNRLTSRAEARDYGAVVDLLAAFVEPVEAFFDQVLVLDPENLPATLHRRELLSRLRGVLTRYFDLRELAGQADRRST
jgi:glycyl-tRNA synthetase beta chain